MRRGYEPRLSVVAAWALEFAPVNVSVVYVQPDGNEFFCIGSRSWMFEELAHCMAQAREIFPWRAAEHVLPPEASGGDRIWLDTFESFGYSNAVNVEALPDNKRMLLLQQLLGRLHIDTAPRAWEPDGNNALLIDSLNGYRMKELGGQSDVYTMHPLASFEQYLSRALEHFANWERGEALSPWESDKPQDYRNHDRSVI